MWLDCTVLRGWKPSAFGGRLGRGIPARYAVAFVAHSWLDWQRRTAAKGRTWAIDFGPDPCPLRNPVKRFLRSGALFRCAHRYTPDVYSGRNGRQRGTLSRGLAGIFSASITAATIQHIAVFFSCPPLRRPLLPRLREQPASPPARRRSSLPVTAQRCSLPGAWPRGSVAGHG